MSPRMSANVFVVSKYTCLLWCHEFHTVYNIPWRIPQVRSTRTNTRNGPHNRYVNYPIIDISTLWNHMELTLCMAARRQAGNVAFDNDRETLASDMDKCLSSWAVRNRGMYMPRNGTWNKVHLVAKTYGRNSKIAVSWEQNWLGSSSSVAVVDARRNVLVPAWM